MKATKTGTPKTATNQNNSTAAPCSCGCQGSSGGGAGTCCQPTCFERPNYFCGQLLNDDDLTAEQVYFREKQRLYHRTLHGHGVVCGLRLTCDTDCSGRIRVGDGYAIDNCGNDLVVCQPTPFDVIAALKVKNYLITESPSDPCEDEEPPRCKIKQCFYVVICYDEVEADFTTPFKTNCGPGAAACEPTRIRETVRFDILDHPPKTRSYLDELEERITCCWKVFTDGPLARALKDFLQDSKDQKNPEGRREYCHIFYQLKVLFQHHLKRSPDLYDCTLWEQVCHLHCENHVGDDYEERYQESFCKLFELIRRYAYDCILGEMIFECPCPPQPLCVLLGTVEVEDGKLLRVCNCPRSYVWTFANFFEVFLATVVVGAACAPHHHVEASKKPAEDSSRAGGSHREFKESHERECCASFDFDCDQFMELLRTRPDFGKLAAAAPIQTIRQVLDSLKTGFNFTHPLAFPIGIFKGMSEEEASILADKLSGPNGKGLLEFIEPGSYETPDPITAILGHMLRRPGDSLVATRTKDRGIERVIPRLQVPPPILHFAGQDDPVKAAEAKAAAAQASVEAMSKELADLRGQIELIRAQIKPAPVPSATPVVDPPKAPPEGGQPL
jgi:hypothetical protein